MATAASIDFLELKDKKWTQK